MEALIAALAPAFAVGLALQALIEWADSPIELIVRGLQGVFSVWKPPLPAAFDASPEEKAKAAQQAEDEKTKHKKAVIRTISVAFGVWMANVLQIHVLAALSSFNTTPNGFQLPLGLEYVDTVISGLVISLGTDGVNQIVKFVEQAKNNQEADADKKDAEKKAAQA